MARKGKGTPKHVQEQRSTSWKIRRRAAEMAAANKTFTDQELIEQALAEGRLTKCPDGIAYGALRWNPFGKTDTN
jgi:hypothetical protein